MNAFWEEFLTSPTYLQVACKRILAGEAPHLENYWLNRTNGKPVERHEITGADGGPIEVHDHFALPPQ